jgi:oxalate decarboxylase/phosphoglucose isomerase-like protein (cupin superfamily)
MSDKRIAVHPEEVDTIVSSWVTAKTLCDPQVTGGGISAVALYFKPGQGHARHNHPETEQLIYVVSGEGEMMIEYEEGHPVTEKITAGSLVNIPKGKYHSTFNTGWEPIRILAVYSPPGPEAVMRNSPEFRILPPGEAPV